MFILSLGLSWQDLRLRAHTAAAVVSPLKAHTSSELVLRLRPPNADEDDDTMDEALDQPIEWNDESFEMLAIIGNIM